ncbi:trp operon leader peptide [Streptomyces sp. NPDC102406]
MRRPSLRSSFETGEGEALHMSRGSGTVAPMFAQSLTRTWWWTAHPAAH